MKTIVLFVLAFLALATCDIYLHFPPGSNNRNREQNTNRNNANRLFDSQNNGKGGYCRGPRLTFYTGSRLHIEWTSQHGCGSDQLYCNVVIQYMCQDSNVAPQLKIRDGSDDETGTIPDDPTGPTQTTGANSELRYGMHETYQYYRACATRQRNRGLFIADRNLGGGRNTARFTRQDNNGNRHGYECQEEREYYPYWHPTPWRDIAIFTQNLDHCNFYEKESQNVKNKGICQTSRDDETPVEPNNKASCEAGGFFWRETGRWGLPKPACMKAWINRQNHLGNGVDGFANTFNWTLPPSSDLPCSKDNNCDCVLRIRYNISTGDLNGMGGNNPSGRFIDSKFNGELSPVQNDEIKLQDGLPHQLALDTSQFGRTFEDRSHVFSIRNRPKNVPGTAKIYNLNVRGKRGNIVQAYPAVEYDFIPTDLQIYRGDYIHFQWTGCDKNPGGNAGEGTASTDRSNIVQITGPDKNHPASDEELRRITPLFESRDLRRRMAMLDQPVNDPNLCLSYEALLAANGNNQNNAEQDTRNCMKLNAASPYFDGGLIKMNLTARFHYMSSRNNNFTNRDQKGSILVENVLPTWAIVIIVIGSVLFLLAGAVAGAMFYSRSHPHSTVAKVLSRM